MEYANFYLSDKVEGFHTPPFPFFDEVLVKVV
jgi:hypothetical protein